MLCDIHIWYSFLLSQKKLQETSLKSALKLKDMEKEFRYIIRYIKVSVFFKTRSFRYIVHTCVGSEVGCAWFLENLDVKCWSSTALHRRSGGGEREDFLQTDLLHRETKRGGEGAVTSPGESGHQSGWGAAGEDTEGGGCTQEDGSRAGEALSHWWSHPLPAGEELKSAGAQACSAILWIFGDTKITCTTLLLISNL